MVERTNKAEIRPEEHGQKTESCRKINWMKYSWKGHGDRNRHKNRIKRSGQARLVYVRHKPYYPHHVKLSPLGLTLYFFTKLHAKPWRRPSWSQWRHDRGLAGTGDISSSGFLSWRSTQCNNTKQQRKHGPKSCTYPKQTVFRFNGKARSIVYGLVASTLYWFVQNKPRNE